MSVNAKENNASSIVDNKRFLFEKDAWPTLINNQKKYASSSENRLVRGRAALLKLRRMVTENEDAFLSALRDDLGKSKVEAFASEIAVTLNEIDFLLRNMRRFLKDKRLLTRPFTRAVIGRRPYGSVLIMGPWNYPFQLALLPLAGALAAGNGCFLKPSEFAPATSGQIAKLAAAYFSPEELVVIEGDGETAAALLDNEWDFIFFTGGDRVGSIIAERAAKLRIPSVLELGGKCPCIVDADSVNEVTARRIVWGKFFNAGQTCVAPDYVMVHESVADDLLNELKQQLIEMYGDNPEQSNDYGRIIGARHFARLQSMLSDGKVFYGGTLRADQLYFEPTIITEPRQDGVLMQEEIFGPILPVLTWSNQEDLLAFLQNKPEPLAVYAFCEEGELIQLLENTLKSGAFCLNNVLEHVAKVSLPFGGIGNSGYGRYHGKASFEAFTWQKVIYKTPQGFDFRLKYPPYQEKHLKIIRRVRRWLP